ncbi:hypothetical protein, partial [Yoonia sp.]|uniref:hypothetical protein n=1 Tax=Yoonia sp. TaxID=2212373 RepID=UPI003A4D649D
PEDAPDDLILVSAGGHAHDADVIIGDNGQIFRLVGVNGVQRTATDYDELSAENAGTLDGTGVRSSGGYLNYNYDFNGAASQGYGSDGNPDTYDRIIVRAVEFLDYTEGGPDFDPAAMNDIGAGDEIHGEALPGQPLPQSRPQFRVILDDEHAHGSVLDLSL